MSRFQMDRDWLVYHPSPKKPDYLPPAGAVDAHCHVFGPGDEFPYAPERKYTPCDAPKEKLWELRDYLGFERNVIVQATCHGADNRARCRRVSRVRTASAWSRDGNARFHRRSARELDAARRALQLREAPQTSPRKSWRDCRAHSTARLAHRHLPKRRICPERLLCRCRRSWWSITWVVGSRSR
jgi:predicted TIM-barrel fold metal-dependent hydrolase